MGTTIVVALVKDARLVFAGVGDSRLYSFTQGTLTQLTQDDSWVSMLLANRTIDAEAIARHPMRHVLTSVVGAREDVECRVQERVLAGEETFLLSTDGLHGTLDLETMESMMRAHGEPAVLGRRTGRGSPPPRQRRQHHRAGPEIRPRLTRLRGTRLRE